MCSNGVVKGSGQNLSSVKAEAGDALRMRLGEFANTFSYFEKSVKFDKDNMLIKNEIENLSGNLF
jgi:hypothetical protein